MRSFFSRAEEIRFLRRKEVLEVGENSVLGKKRKI